MNPTDNQRPTGEEAIAILDRLQAEGHVSEALVQEQLAAVRRGLHSEIRTRVAVAGQVETKRELEPAQIEQLVETIAGNFRNNSRELPKLHPNIKWADVERALRANPTLLVGLSKMEETGGMVDVIGEDNGSFLFGDTSSESPKGRRNVVFDREAEDYLREHYPQERCNGNASDRVSEWGVDFMDETQYRAMQKHGRFDAQTWSWLKTPSNVRVTGGALDGFRRGERVFVNLHDARDHDDYRGFRCALRVPKVKD